MYDVIGDIHGSYPLLVALLDKLGYGVEYSTQKWIHPEGRSLIYCGDLVDRNPYPVEVLKTVMSQVKDGTARLVISNHDDRLRRYLRDELAGDKIKVKVGKNLSQTLSEVNREGLEFKKELYEFLNSLPYKVEFETPTGQGTVVHAALIEGRKEKIMREMALVGETNGETDKNGYPIRTYNWINQYSGSSRWICHGHDIVGDSPRLIISNKGVRIWGIDTGAYKSGILSCIRFPEEQIVQVYAQASV